MIDPITQYKLNEYTMEEYEISNIIYDRYIEQVEDMESRCKKQLEVDKKRLKNKPHGNIEIEENYAVCKLWVYQRAGKMWKPWAKSKIRSLCKANPKCIKRAIKVYNKVKRENEEDIKSQMNRIKKIRQKYKQENKIMIDPITQYILEKQKFFGMSSGPNYEREMQYAVEVYASHYKRGMNECKKKSGPEEYKCYVKVTREFNKILTRLAKEKRAECNKISDPKQKRECNVQVGRVIEGEKAENNRDIQVWRSNY